METMGSQFGMIIIVVIGLILVRLFVKVTGKQPNEEQGENILGCLFYGGAAVAVICFVLSQCS